MRCARAPITRPSEASAGSVTPVTLLRSGVSDDQSGPCTASGTGAAATSRCSTGPTSAGVKRRPSSTAGPRFQPFITQTSPPAISNARPVTSQSALPSHTTNGDTLAGSIASKPVSGRAIISGIASSVIRLRADGAMVLATTP